MGPSARRGTGGARRAALTALLVLGLALCAGSKKQSRSKNDKQKKVDSTTSGGAGVDGDLSDMVETFVDEEDQELMTLTTLDDIKNSTSCADLGYPDISQYQYLFPIDVKYTLLDESTDKLFLPVLSTHDLSKKNKNVKKVMFAMHGKEGDVDTYFCLAKYAADQYALRHGKEKDEVAVIAPWFSEEQNTAEDWAGDNAKSAYDDYMSIYWASSSWISSSNDACNATSTFDALDSLVETALNPKVFPHAKRLSLVGFSAGGQVVARYAWATSVSLSGADSDSEVETLRYIVSDPSSYLYLSPERPDPSCVPMYDSGYSKNTNHDYCTTFSSDTDTVPNIAECSDYDTWKYGLTTFEDTATYSYFADYAADQDLVDKQTTKLRSKDVRYVFGTADTCNCNSVGYTNPSSTDSMCFPTDSDGNALSCSPNDGGTSGCCDTYPGSTNNELSTSCGAELQGYNRMQRGLVYMSYLKWFWSKHDYSPSYTMIVGLSHDAETMYKSDIVSTWSFSDDDSQEEIEATQDVVVISLDSLSTSSGKKSAAAPHSGGVTVTSAAATATHGQTSSVAPSSWFIVALVLTGMGVGAYTWRAVSYAKPALGVVHPEDVPLVSKLRMESAI